MFITLLTKDSAHVCESMIPDKYLSRKLLLGVICLNDEGEAIGCAVVEPEEETLMLQWIYVLPEYRKMGSGSMMLRGIKEMATAMDAREIETYFEGEDIEEFLLSSGFMVTVDNPVYSFDLTDISLTAICNKTDNNDICVPFEKLNSFRKGNLLNRFRQEGAPDFTPFCDENLSYCYLNSDDEACGCILISQDSDLRRLNVDLLINFTGDKGVTMKLIEKAVMKAVESTPDDYRVSFIGANPGIKAMVSMLLNSKDQLSEDGNILRGVCVIEEGESK